ncbi:sugar porter family MFS transporter [Actinocorallia longicatena]|uniref:Sugar porter family MFS transporter n=1 Tax=Actinocorallia longicatena TaxID=111803 RepID=A0ABP6QAR6_9ACTN
MSVGDEQLKIARNSHKSVRVAGAAAMGGFLFGYDSSVINGAVDAIQADFGINSTATGFVVSSALLGCAVGAWFAGPLAERWGRIRVMIVAAIVFVISALGSASAFAVWDLTLWRVLGGLAIGASSVIAPAYIAEISPAALRGRLGSLQQMAIVLGIFAALLVDYLIVQLAGSASAEFWLGIEAWRWMFATAAVPAVIYGLLALKIPESPRYLVRKGRLPEARRVLAGVVGEPDPDHKIKEIQETIAGDRPVRLGDLRGGLLGLLPIVWVGILLSVFQQFVGINVIFYYSSTLWQAVGFSESDATLTSVITSVVNVVATLVAIALVDRVGRKPLLVVGAAGMTVTLAIMAVAFGTATVVDGEPRLDGAAGPIALVAANIYVFAFAATWGPVVWVMLGEMFSNRIRASALAVAAAAQWLANWLITTSFPPLSDAGLGLAYGLYTLFAALALLFVLKMVKETKGKELEQMT